MPGLAPNSFFKGFHIQTQVDPRWILDDHETNFFVARIFSEDTIIVGKPGLSYDHLFAPEEFPIISDNVRNKMDEYRNIIVPQFKQKIVHYEWTLLKFPPRKGMSSIKLSVKEIYKPKDHIKDETLLELQHFPVETVHDVAGSHLTWWATW